MEASPCNFPHLDAGWDPAQSHAVGRSPAGGTHVASSQHWFVSCATAWVSSCSLDSRPHQGAVIAWRFLNAPASHVSFQRPEARGPWPAGLMSWPSEPSISPRGVCGQDCWTARPSCMLAPSSCTARPRPKPGRQTQRHTARGTHSYPPPTCSARMQETFSKPTGNILHRIQECGCRARLSL
jgi:hypothetical protein